MFDVKFRLMFIFNVFCSGVAMVDNISTQFEMLVLTSDFVSCSFLYVSWWRRDTQKVVHIVWKLNTGE